MAWEQRGIHSYYYRKEREGSRVRSVYVGGGEKGALIAQLETMMRDESEASRDVRRRELAKLERQDAPIETACRMIDAILEATLIVAGFHTHKRQWRRRRYVDNG